MKKYAITIARGFGSGGRTLSFKLADELGIHSYENRILTLAAHYSGYEEKDFVEVNEKLRGGYIGSKLKALQKHLAPIPQLEHFSSDDKLFEIQSDIIRKIVDEESCIIVGKCADHILKDYDNVLSVYIEAPRVYCRSRIMERMGVTPAEADHLINKTDKYRAEYYKYYTGGKQWDDPTNYDIVLNSARLGERKCIEMIKSALQVKLGIVLDDGKGNAPI